MIASFILQLEQGRFLVGCSTDVEARIDKLKAGGPGSPYRVRKYPVKSVLKIFPHESLEAAVSSAKAITDKLVGRYGIDLVRGSDEENELLRRIYKPQKPNPPKPRQSAPASPVNQMQLPDRYFLIQTDTGGMFMGTLKPGETKEDFTRKMPFIVMSTTKELRFETHNPYAERTSLFKKLQKRYPDIKRTWK